MNSWLSRPCLVIICGPPLAGKSSLATALAESLGGKTAIIHHDELLERWITVHDEDAEAERDMTLNQVKLLAVNYLKSGYNLVIEGTYAAYRDGIAYNFTDEIKALIGITSSVARRNLVLVLTASENDMQRRADAVAGDAAVALAIARAYDDWLPGVLRLHTSVLGLSEATNEALRVLRKQVS